MSETQAITYKYTSEEDQKKLRKIALRHSSADALWLIGKLQSAWIRIDLLSASIVEIDQKHLKKEK